MGQKRNQWTIPTVAGAAVFMKILLIGRNGQVGHELSNQLLVFGTVIALDRQQLDLTDNQQIELSLKHYQPDVIVNAAAYTQVDQAEKETELAVQINCHAVKIMADYAIQNKVLLIHYSTDYVFSGEQTTAYVETDPVKPINAYGHSKCAGEQAIINSGCQAFIFRTSWVYAAYGHNFIKTVLKLIQERDKLTMISDQCGVPTSAELIAQTTALALYGFHTNGLKPGLFHLCPAGETNWHDISHHIFDYAKQKNMRLSLNKEDITAITSEQYPVLATRPKSSRLNNQALEHALGIQFPPWQSHLDRALDQLTNRELS